MFCHGKHTFIMTKEVFCHAKITIFFWSQQKLYLWWEPPMIAHRVSQYHCNVNKALAGTVSKTAMKCLESVRSERQVETSSPAHHSHLLTYPVPPAIQTTGKSPFSPQTQSRIGMMSLRMWLLRPPLSLSVYVSPNRYPQRQPTPL